MAGKEYGSESDFEDIVGGSGFHAFTGISGQRGERQKPQDTAAQRHSFSLFSRTLQSGEAVWVMASFMSSLTLYRGQTQLTNSVIV